MAERVGRDPQRFSIRDIVVLVRHLGVGDEGQRQPAAKKLCRVSRVGTAAPLSLIEKSVEIENCDREL